jgi:hypothetical protein
MTTPESDTYLKFLAIRSYWDDNILSIADNNDVYV